MPHHRQHHHHLHHHHMEIVIENPSPNDAAGTSTPNRVGTLNRPVREVYPGEPVGPILLPTNPPANPDYYAWKMGNHPNVPLVPSDLGDVDGASCKTAVRRVDRSGLLEIPEMEPAGRCRPRHLTGAESVGGTLSRRIDRSGLLEAVPEVPDQQQQTQRNPDDDPAIVVSNDDSEQSRTSSMAERQLTGAELTEERQQPMSLSPRPNRSPSDLESQLTRRRSLAESRCSLNEAELQRIATNKIQSATPDSQQNTSGLTVTQTNRPSSTSPIFHSRLQGTSSNFHELSTQTLGRNIRNRVHFASKGSKFTPIENSSLSESSKKRHFFGSLNISTNPTATSMLTSSPTMSTKTTTSTTTITTPSSTTTKKEELSNSGESVPGTVGSQEQSDSKVPEGERAEAEGCEHSAVESVEEARVSFKSPNNKILHNDNIQTLRVIILSEQL